MRTTVLAFVLLLHAFVIAPISSSQQKRDPTADAVAQLKQDDGFRQPGIEKLLILGPPSPKAKASIEGTVIALDTGRAVPNLTVVLARTGRSAALVALMEDQPAPSDIAPVTTDNQGRFAFRDLEGDSYKLDIVSSGYILQADRSAIRVGSGVDISNLELRVARKGSLRGHVRAIGGQAARAVPVQLLQGRPGSLTFVAETKSDERGDYRLDDIMPGSYILAAGAALARVPLTETLNSADGEYAFTYYPGSSTPDFTRALVIDGTGRELQADFLLSPERRHHIRGRILVERNGDHPSAVTATLRSTAPTGLLRGNFPSDNALFRYEPRNGTFEVSDLLPGQYTLSISARIDDGAQIDGSTTVTIRDFDVDGEVIALIQYKTQR